MGDKGRGWVGYSGGRGVVIWGCAVYIIPEASRLWGVWGDSEVWGWCGRMGKWCGVTERCGVGRVGYIMPEASRVWGKKGVVENG